MSNPHVIGDARRIPINRQTALIIRRADPRYILPDDSITKLTAEIATLKKQLAEAKELNTAQAETIFKLRKANRLINEQNEILSKR